MPEIFLYPYPSRNHNVQQSRRKHEFRIPQHPNMAEEAQAPRHIRRQGGFNLPTKDYKQNLKRHRLSTLPHDPFRSHVDSAWHRGQLNRRATQSRFHQPLASCSRHRAGPTRRATQKLSKSHPSPFFLLQAEPLGGGQSRGPLAP